MAQGSLPAASIDVLCSQRSVCLDGKTTTVRVLNIFWLDVFESTNNPGQLYVFGKVRMGSAYQSCCVTVNNMHRRLLFLPRKTKCDAPHDVVTIKDVQEEVCLMFQKRFSSSNTSKFAFSSRPITKKYVFGLEAPEETEYLEVLYPASILFPDTWFTGNTFSRVFNTHTSCVEHFIIQQDIRGELLLKLVQVACFAPC